MSDRRERKLSMAADDERSAQGNKGRSNTNTCV